MDMFVNTIEVHLYTQIVDFRKAINGLSLIVEQEMDLPLFDECLFVFCNRGRDKIKILYWERNGFCLRPPGMAEGRAMQERLPSKSV